MYKTIKIPEAAFRHAEQLKSEMSTDDSVKGVRKVTLSEAVSYAIKAALESREKRRHLIAAAGGWSDMDCDALFRDIYSSRVNSTREIVF
jgi:hypothetical protein